MGTSISSNKSSFHGRSIFNLLQMRKYPTVGYDSRYINGMMDQYHCMTKKTFYKETNKFIRSSFVTLLLWLFTHLGILPLLSWCTPWHIQCIPLHPHQYNCLHKNCDRLKKNKRFTQIDHVDTQIEATNITWKGEWHWRPG